MWMNDTPEQDAQHQKKLYVKPTLRRVQLKADEAVLGNCKTTSVSGPLQATCDSPSSCLTIAS